MTVDRLGLFLKHVNKTEACWLWTGSTVTGYGNFGYGENKTGPAHRWAYEYFVGPIPPGLWLDHLCRVRNCVRPDHLEPVTPSENQRRRHAARPDPTHCKRRHPLPVGHPRGKACPACRRGEDPLPLEELQVRVAKRLESTSTYADSEQDVVDGLLSDVIEAVRVELNAGAASGQAVSLMPPRGGPLPSPGAGTSGRCRRWLRR